MPTRKTEDRNIRSLTKIAGKSFGITIPIEFIRKLSWQEKQKLEVNLEGRKLVIKDWRK